MVILLLVIYLVSHGSCLETPLTGHWLSIASTQWDSSLTNDSFVDGMGFLIILLRVKIGRTNKDSKRFLMKIFLK